VSDCGHGGSATIVLNFALIFKVGHYRFFTREGISTQRMSALTRKKQMMYRVYRVYRRKFVATLLKHDSWA
jgi:hypothetical protein